MTAEESSSSLSATTGAARQPGLTSRRQVWLGAVLVLVVFLTLLEGKLWRKPELFVARHNVQIAEATAWLDGRLHLSERTWDTAPVDGRAYSHLPVLFTLLAAAVVPVFEGVPRWFIFIVVVLPIPILSYRLGLRRTGSPLWGAVLAIGFVCGTSAWPVIVRSLRGGGPYFINHTLATVGLLIFLTEYFGQRRVWLCGLGLIVATLSRQMTAAFAIPLLFLAVWHPTSERRWLRLGQLAAVGLVIAAVPLGMNLVKFGNPLDTGYLRIYEGRERPRDKLALDANTYGLFSAHFVPRNLYYMNIGPPKILRIRTLDGHRRRLRPNVMGTGIWWTTPLLVWLFVDFRRILSNPEAGLLLASAGLVYLGLLFFHATGYAQLGYNRFSLDFLPALFALIAPGCFTGRRRWISLAMIAWSIVYFRCLI